MGQNKVCSEAFENVKVVINGSTDGHVETTSRSVHNKGKIPQPSEGKFSRFCRRLQHHATSRYSCFTWTTRQTINEITRLLALTYVLISVPFRVGFLYNPSDKTGWTSDLSAFTSLDVLVDVVGMVEFSHVYYLWRAGISWQTEADKFEQEVKRNRHARNAELTPTRNPEGAQIGKVKWTLANIGRPAIVNEASTDAFTFQKPHGGRNWEILLEGIALLPLEVGALAWGAFNALHLVRLSKLCRLYKFRRCFARVTVIYSDRPWIQELSSTGINSLVRTIGYCVATCHWAACGYMITAHTQCGISLLRCDPDIERSWVVRDQLFGATVARKYSRALYWAARTIVLLGYGDTTPVSTAETVYAMAVQFAGALLCSSMLANFVFIFHFRNAGYSAFSRHVDNARDYMRLKGIPRAICLQVIAYLNYSWNTHRSLDSEEALHLMPEHLQSKVISTLKATLITQVCFLAKESVEFINLLALKLARRVYSPSDQIVEPNTTPQMFFVIRGDVIVSSVNGLKTRKCQSGDYFAESCLLYPEQYDEKAVARTFCELYVLDKVNFDGIVSHCYRGSEMAIIAQMAEILDKHSTQQRKTQKLLGQGERTSVSSVSHHESGYRAGRRKRIKWNLPDSTFRTIWDAMRLIGIIYVAFEVPYYSVFVSMTEDENIFPTPSLVGFRYVCTLLFEVFFAVDIVLRGRYLAYLDPVVMLNVVDPHLIFAAYRESGFYLDLVAWLPIGLVMESMPSSAARQISWVLQLPRLLRLRSLPKLLRDLSEAYGISSQLRLVLYLLLNVALLLHIVGCAWFEMAWIPKTAQSRSHESIEFQNLTTSECLRRATVDNSCSWVKFDCFAHIGAVFQTEDDTSLYDGGFAYVRAVYWAVSTLTAVGYDDILAFSTAESYFAAMWIFIGGIINFGVVGAMSHAISSMTEASHSHLETLNTLSRIMERMGISKKLSAEICRFYNNHFMGRKLAYESQLLANLPDQLCYQISSLLHSNAVKRVDLFDSATVEFLQDVTGKFRHRTYDNGETICMEGDVCREFIVLLQDSKIDVFFRSRAVPVRALHEGDCYGVYEFLLKRAHPATLIAASSVHASVMTTEQFDGIQRKFDGDLRDMKIEAQSHWSEQQILLRHIATNLERVKLKPHVMATPTLFYHKEINAASGSSRAIRREVASARTLFTSAWTAGIAIWNAYNAFFVIFRIGFHSHLRFSTTISTFVWLADFCGDLSYVADIYLRLYFFSFPDAGIDNLFRRRYIDNIYRRSSGFKWAVMASLPLYVPLSSDSLAVSLCRLPRLVRCVDLWGYMDEMIVQVQQHFASWDVLAYLRPVKLVIGVVFAAHVGGCIFVLCSGSECATISTCWLAEYDLLDKYGKDVWMVYGEIMYWAVTTLLQINTPVDIVPRSIIATAWTVVICLACTFAMGYVIGEITDLLLGFGKELKEFKTRVAGFEEFAKANELPETLRKRIRYFLRFQFDNTESDELTHMTHHLSTNLRLKLNMEIYGHVIARLPISHFFSSTQISNISQRLKSELFIPGDSILTEESLGSRMFILRRGTATACWASSVTCVAVLLENALFGEIAFFLPNQRRLITARATSSCEVLFLTRRDWEELWTPTGDPSDDQIQKHALSSILDWVNSRIQRYQRQCLNVAWNARCELAARQELANSVAKPKRSLKSASRAIMLQLTRRKSNSAENQPTTFNLPPQIQNPTPRQPSVAPDALTFERKMKYLLSKTDTHRKRFGSVVDAKQKDNPKIVLHAPPTVESPPRRGGSSTSPRKVRSNSAQEVASLEFIIDLNPVNKQICETLNDEQLLRLKLECWRRFKRYTVAQDALREMIASLVPAKQNPKRNTAFSPVKPRGKTKSLKWKSERKGSVDLQEIKAFKQNVKLLTNRSKTSSSLDRAKDTASAAILKNKRTPFSRRISKIDFKKTSGPKLRQLGRSQSLPSFGRQFFKKARDELARGKLTGDGWPAGAQIDFETLQRHQRPQYEGHLRLYHAYRTWKDRGMKLRDLFPVNQKDENKVQPAVPLLGSNVYAGSTRRLNSGTAPRTGGIADEGKLQRRRGRLQGFAMTDSMTRDFVSRVKRFGKMWDTAQLLVAVYYVIITPFKICFSGDLTAFGDDVLWVWAAIETFLDTLLFVDVAYKIRYAFRSRSTGMKKTRLSVREIRQIFVTNRGLQADVIAMFPFELLVLVPNLRASLEYHSDGDSAWWATRWILRVNRMLFGWRIEPLSESLLQYVVYDCNVSVSALLFNFWRSLASYVAAAHFLACIWFASSAYSLHQYGESWLSTSGMLLFIPPTVSSPPSDAFWAFFAGIPLSRKYVRSLYFGVQCVTTLLYGDIISVTRLESIVEVTISVWGIYVFAIFVGVQEELFNARIRQEAIFEQHLASLQMYLIQNGVPRTLKLQVKAYYAHMWHRTRGDADFAAIEGVSTVLREDVVFTTLRDFVERVEIFRGLDEPFLRALLVCLQYVVCSEGENVVVAGDVDRSMYFVAQGQILIELGAAETTREQGEYFGELSLLYGVSRLKTCVAVTVSELYRLDYEPYERLLAEFPEYRVRNRIAWTTTPFERRSLLKTLNEMRWQGPAVALLNTHEQDHSAGLTQKATRIESELSRSYVYLSAMKMLARVHDIDPLEAKDVVMKARVGGYKHIKARRSSSKLHDCGDPDEQAVDDMIYRFGYIPRDPSIRIIHVNHQASADGQWRIDTSNKT